jgi:hypothetical protein
LDSSGAISVVNLRSPRETWFLLSGNLTGANGPNNRMRLYAHEGHEFQTVWIPEDVWGDFTVSPRDFGFTVTGTYYRGGTREDQYGIAADRVYLMPK